MITALHQLRHYGEVEVEISSSWRKWRAFVDPEVDRATIRLANNVRAYANEDER
ncbi:MAG: hypothetical protein ACLU4N_03790 [Butyricimonas faecihominis]